MNQLNALSNRVEYYGLRHKLGNIIGITFNKVAICEAAFGKAQLGYIQKLGVDINCNNMPRNLGNLQSETAVTRTQVNHGHAGPNTDLIEYARGVRP